MSFSAFSVTGTSSPSNVDNAILEINGTSNEIVAATSNNVATIGLDPSVLSELSALQAKLNNLSGSDDNLLINGSLQIWQRNTSFSLTGPANAYTADRWQVAVGGTDPITVQQVSGDKTGSWMMKLIRTANTASTGQVDISQSVIISRCLGSQGRTLYFVFQASSGSSFSAANAQITAQVWGGRGAANQDQSALTSPFANQSVLASQNFNLLQSLSTFTLEVTVPNNITQLAVDINYQPAGQAGGDDSITLGQLYLGPNSAPVLNQDFNKNLKDCLPYYQKSYSYGTPVGTLGQLPGMFFSNYSGTLGTNYALAGPIFTTPMRASPTLKTYNFNTSNANALSSGDNSIDYPAGTAIPYNTHNEKGFDISNSVSGVNAVFGGFKYHWEASAELY